MKSMNQTSYSIPRPAMSGGKLEVRQVQLGPVEVPTSIFVQVCNHEVLWKALDQFWPRHKRIWYTWFTWYTDMRI